MKTTFIPLCNVCKSAYGHVAETCPTLGKLKTFTLHVLPQEPRQVAEEALGEEDNR